MEVEGPQSHGHSLWTLPLAFGPGGWAAESGQRRHEKGLLLAARRANLSNQAGSSRA